MKSSKAWNVINQSGTNECALKQGTCVAALMAATHRAEHCTFTMTVFLSKKRKKEKKNVMKIA